MSLLRDVYHFGIQNDLFSCRTLLVAVSGGADSMCLLDISDMLSSENNKQGVQEGKAKMATFPRICAVHVNHMIRGKEADRDEALVRTFCKERDIELTVRTVDVPKLAKSKKLGLEETGRDVRLAAFQEISRTLESQGQGPVYIAIAHHREDSAETFMINLFRGAGVDGLSGMTPKNANFVRPLLFSTKKQILDHLSSRQISYCEDLTNADTTYRRNFFRNDVFPRIREAYGKDPVLPCLTTAELLRRDKDYFEEVVQRCFLQNVIKTNSMTALPCELIRREHISISSRLIRKLYTETFGDVRNFTEVHLKQVRNLCAEAKGGTSSSLPGRRIAFIREGALYFFDRTDNTAETAIEESLCMRGLVMLTAPDETMTDLRIYENGDISRTSVHNSSILLETNIVENPSQLVYNNRAWYCTIDELNNAVVRTRRAGDVFSRAGSTGGKPFRRYLTDRKIPVSSRDRILCVARGSDILWVPGLAHATGFVDLASREHYLASRGISSDTDKEKNTLVKISFIDLTP